MKKTTILVVDDYEPWRSMLRSQLQTNPDFQVIGEASNGCEAVEKSAALHPDVVLLDIAMPILNGMEAGPKIRRVSPGSGIIFLTQEQDDEIRTAALAAGAEGYVLKSNFEAELTFAIHALLDKRQPTFPVLSPSFALG